MTFRHIRAHNGDHVGIRQITGKGSSRTAAKCDPQTGDRCRVSNAGLVFDGDDPRGAQEFLVGVVPLIVKRCPAEREDA